MRFCPTFALVAYLASGVSGAFASLQACAKQRRFDRLSGAYSGNRLRNEVPFMGIELSLYYDGLKTNHFETLKTGSSIFRVVDLSTIYDLNPQATSRFLQVRGSLGEDHQSFNSRGKAKASKRTILQEDSCTADKLELTANSVKNCETLARAAAKDASDVHSARFVEYFKSNETQAREHVTGRLLAVAEECSTSDSGNTRVFCRDEIGYCESDGPLIAYTTWVNGYVTMCPLFYDTLPPLPQKCHKQDHATTTIHEMTHARAVYEQEVSTQDYAYGYENSTALDPLSCLYNADSYSLYANAVYLDC
ncbi:hypothetical protein ACKAV7_010843 [Fusarium commune]